MALKTLDEIRVRWVHHHVTCRERRTKPRGFLKSYHFIAVKWLENLRSAEPRRPIEAIEVTQLVPSARMYATQRRFRARERMVMEVREFDH